MRKFFILIFFMPIMQILANNAESNSPTTFEKDPSIRSKWQLENAVRKSYIENEKKKEFKDESVSAYVIPITGEINSAQHYILRRGLKEAMRNNIDLVILDVNTPGGALDTTLDIMKSLTEYKGDIAAFVNDEAISAGSFICIATDEIYFAPGGTMGAAEPITSTGEDIGDSVKRKLSSYIDAKVRSLTKDHRYRAEVQKAMMNPDFILKIDDVIIKDEGELLTLTADEAIKEYGDPPATLLAAGIATDIHDLLKQRHGEHYHTIRNFKLSWSEHLAKWLNKISPIIMGLAMLLVFIEFKTAGFGVFGISGIMLFLLMFASHYIAGLAGYEPILVFVIGVILLAIELFLFPGIMVAGIIGMLMVFGAMIWSMMDLWPGNALSFDPSLLISPLNQLAIAFAIAVAGIIFLAKVLPDSWFWSKLVLSSTVPGSNKYTSGGGSTYAKKQTLPPVGSQGVSTTKMFPSGEVEIDGIRYLARVNSAMLEIGINIVVVDHKAFQLIVEEDVS